MTAPYWLITYHEPSGRQVTRQVRDKADGWPEYYKARAIDPGAALYVIREGPR